jgi:hypothetical protein
MARFRIGDEVRAQRSLGALHESAIVVGTPTHVMPRTLDGAGGEHIEQIEVEFEDGERVTLVADSPAVGQPIEEP